MSASLNKVFLIGNLTADPELKYTPNGKARTKFRIAINRQYKDNSGQLQEETTFIPIVVWGAQAESCANYLSKGRSVAVEGRIRVYNFTDDTGQEVRWFEVVAQRVQFLGGPTRGAEPGTVPPGGGATATPSAPAHDDKGTDEEVPF